jgi:hypothetical protein
MEDHWACTKGKNLHYAQIRNTTGRSRSFFLDKSIQKIAITQRERTSTAAMAEKKMEYVK